ncbi:MAG: hypothetical protein CUN57_03765, partial [Phototrophicales bacterium]
MVSATENGIIMDHDTNQDEKSFMNNAMNRRSFLSIGAATLGGVLVPAIVTPALAVPLPERKGGTRHLAFRNTHTGDSFNGVFRVGDKYLPDAFDQINYV